MKEMQQMEYGDLLRVPEELVQIDGNPSGKYVFSKEGENILYSVAFRNMSAKTQVFHSNARGNLRTRLTHTLEVARIAMDISKALGFDEKLAEAIALGHDLGHTPFGHVGERAIHKFSSGEDRKYTSRDGRQMKMPEAMKGFKHNLQSVRLLVDYTVGCKFSNFVLYGIREHSSTAYQKLGANGRTNFYDIYNKNCSVVLDDGQLIPAWSVEAFLVKWADEIAQRHHDIEDAYYQKIMSPNQIVHLLMKLNCISETEDLRKIYSNMEKIAQKSEDISDKEREEFPHYLTEFIIGVYVSGSIHEFGVCLKKVVEKYGIQSKEDFLYCYKNIRENEIKEMFSLKNAPIGIIDAELNKGLKYAILDSYEVQRMDGRSEYIVRRLLRAYKANPQQLPNIYINRLIKEECFKYLSDKETREILDKIHKELNYDINNVEKWADYECRNALGLLLDDPVFEKLISPILMRMVFDYVAFMTDSYAYEEYKELYE